MRRAAVIDPDSGVVLNVVVIHDENERIPPGLTGVVVLSLDAAVGPGWVSEPRTDGKSRRFAVDTLELALQGLREVVEDVE